VELLKFGSYENHRGISKTKEVYSGAVGYFILMAILTLMWLFILTIKKNTPSLLVVITSLSVPEKSMKNAY
jgi:hypothetical protein